MGKGTVDGIFDAAVGTLVGEVMCVSSRCGVEMSWKLSRAILLLITL